MAIGNLEAIRDWMIGGENNDPMWYTKDEIMYIVNAVGEEYVTWSPYYMEDTGKFVTINGRGYNKPNPGAAYVCGQKPTGSYTAPLVVSTIPEAAKITTSAGHAGDYQTTVEFMGRTWYCNSGWGFDYNNGVSPSNRTFICYGANTLEKQSTAFLKHIYGIK